jgi:hypothetical protein
LTGAKAKSPDGQHSKQDAEDSKKYQRSLFHG